MKTCKKIISVLTPVSLLILISSTASADIFLMKNGTTINGSIISETEDSYLLKAEATKNVYVEKTVLKSKVAQITKVDPSIQAFRKLGKILPTPDLMNVREYEFIIKSKLKPFLKNYPSSPYFKDVEKISQTLQKEYRLIKAGGFKINGKLITPVQVEADKYNVQASVALHNFIRFAQKKQYRAALGTLEQLENGYADTVQCRKAQKLALNILPLYEEKLQKLYDNVDQMIEKRDRALASMTTDDSSRTKKIFESEAQQYKNMLDIATANKAQNKWLPINSYFKEPIYSNLKMVETEIKRISAAIEKPTLDMGKFYHTTYAALENGNYTLAKESFDKFNRGRPPEELINELEPRLKVAKMEMDKQLAKKLAEELLAKKLAAEEAKRLAKEKREAGKLKPTDDRAVGDKVRDKLNLNKKQNTIDRIPK